MTQTNVRVQMQIRRDTAANWNSANPVLLIAEWGFETDSGKIKIGDGSTAWQQLDYAFVSTKGGNMTDHFTIHSQKELRLSDHVQGGAQEHYSAFKAGVQSTNATYTLPTALPASSGQVLACTDAGVMSWASDSTTDSTKMPLAGGTFVGDVIFDNATNAGNDMTWDMSDNLLEFADNTGVSFGASKAFQIYHNGASARLENAIGDLLIRNTASNEIKIQALSGEQSIVANANGSVDLYFDGAGPKLETTSLGTKITGDLWLDNPDNAGKDIQFDSSESKLKFDDGVKANFGSGDDLAIFHDTHSYIRDATTAHLRIENDNVRIRNGGSSETMITATVNDSINLYFDNSKKIETLSAGIEITGTLVFDSSVSGGTIKLEDDQKLFLGSGDNLKIYHTGSSSQINDTTSELYIQSDLIHYRDWANGDYYCKMIRDGAFEAYFNNSLKMETYAAGVSVTGTLTVGTGNITIHDSGRLKLGTSDDLQIYFNGTNTFYDTREGDSFFRAVGNIYLQNQASDGSSVEDMAKFLEDGAFEAYYDNTKRIETKAWGCKTVGIHLASADASQDYALQTINAGNSVNRYGLRIQCGANDGSGTNYAVGFETPTGVAQGTITFTSGTVTYGPFTANHPCIVPDADNPSDSSNAYPYGTLLETISIEYTKDNGVNTERGIRYKVQKTQSANSKKVLGAYGGSMNGGPNNQTNEHQALVLGDGHILVNNAGGNIEIGDGICSSATAGIGQKATASPSMIIGIAQENITFTGTETKLIAVQYGLQQFTPWS